MAELVRANTTNPPGREAQAARVLRDFFFDQGVEVELFELSPGRSSVFAKLPGTDTTHPVVLITHLDTLRADPGGWRSDRPPTGGVVKEDKVWGRGALWGKGPASVYACALAVLQKREQPLDRPIWFFATADGVGDAKGIEQLITQKPAILTSPIILGDGGLFITDLFEKGIATVGIATSEKGRVRLNIVAERKPDHRAKDAPARLARALERIEARHENPELTPPFAATLNALADAMTFPRSMTLTNRPLIAMFELPSLVERNATRHFITNTFSITRLNSDGGDGTIVERAQAIVDARILPGVDPAELVAELRALIDDEKVHVTIISGEAATESPIDDDLVQRIGAHLARPGLDQVVVPTITPFATDLRVLRRHRVKAAYGITPFVVSWKELETIRGREEYVSVANLEAGMRSMTGLLLSLAVD